MDNNTTRIEDDDNAVTVALPANIIAQIDAQVGGAFVDRDDFIRSAVRYYLEHIRETQGVSPRDIG